MISTPLRWLRTLSLTSLFWPHQKSISYAVDRRNRRGELQNSLWVQGTLQGCERESESWRGWIWASGPLTPCMMASVARLLIMSCVHLSSSIFSFIKITIIFFCLICEVSPLGQEFVPGSQVEGKLCWKRVRFKMLLNALSNLVPAQKDDNLHSCPQVSVSPLKIKHLAQRAGTHLGAGALVQGQCIQN